jgi:hypothetical protein
VSNNLGLSFTCPPTKKGVSVVLPNKLQAEFGTAPATEVGKIQCSCFS